MTNNDYAFKTKPYEHQSRCFRLSRDRIYYAYFAEMGTGKTKMCLDNIAWLYLQGRINAALIIAPKGVYENWYSREIPTHIPDEVKYAAALWSPVPRKAHTDAFKAMMSSDGLRLFVMNVEALSTENGQIAAKRFLCAHKALCAIDESTTTKSIRARRTKACIKLGTFAEYRRILSGEPAANSPLDMFAQMMFLSPNVLGFTSFTAFKARYAVEFERHTSGGQRYFQVTGYRNLEELSQKIQQHAFIIKKDDCLDLPPKTYTTYEVAMTPRQLRAYEQMRAEAIIELDKLTHTLEEETMDFEAFQTCVESPVDHAPSLPSALVTANIVLTQMLRLQQVLLGYVKADNGALVNIDESGINPRMETLLTLCSKAIQHGSKAIVWTQSVQALEEIVARLREQHGPESVVHFYGKTKAEERSAAIDSFQDRASHVRFFVGNPTVAGRGNTLTAARTVIFYSNSFDREIRMQAEDRAHRIGQTHSVQYIDLVVPRTIDSKILERLNQKGKNSSMVTPSNWRSMLE